MKSVYLRNVKDYSHTYKESLRAIKTNIQYCGDDIKVIMFTSSIANEGKSTVTIDLARTFTDAGKSILIIDSDMRNSSMIGQLQPKISEKKSTAIVGLSQYLSGQNSLQEVIYESQITGLSLLFSGRSVSNSTELLEKKYFTQLMEYARDKYDYIFIDCAPLGEVIDAAVVAKYCDGAVLVIAQGMAGGRIVLNTKKQLETTGVHILGVVMNKVKLEKRGYGKYYGRYYGKYYGKKYGNYGEEDRDNNENRAKTI